jgi:replicative DNA helicase
MREWKIDESILCLLTRGESNWQLAESAGLIESDFTDSDARDVFRKLKSLRDNGVALEWDNIKTRLDTKQRETWIAIFGNGPIATNIGYFINALRNNTWKLSVMEQIKVLAKHVANFDPYDPPDNLKGRVHQFAIEATQGSHHSIGGESVAVIFDRICKDYDAREPDKVVSGIPTGIKKLDQMISGFCPGSVYTVAARTGLGKTTLACNFAVNAAATGKRVTFFTIEMTADEVTEKFISKLSSVPVLKMENRSMDDVETDAFYKAGLKLSPMPIKVVDVDRNFSTLVSHLTAIDAMKSTDLVVIDYIQLLKQPGANFKARNYELGDIMTELKLMAKRMGVPFIILAQLNRSVETAEGLRAPNPGDLKDSGSIEQDSNCIMFIHRDQNQHQLIVAKNRKGPIGAIPLKVDMRTNKMEGADEIQNIRLPYKD